MDWTSILTFATGALTALIPVIIANRFQAKEREKDRLEQRREAKIQTREKWIERDILKIMDSMEHLTTLMSEVENLSLRLIFVQNAKESSLLSTAEFTQELKVVYARVPVLTFESNRVLNIMANLVNSFEEPEINLSFKDFRSIGRAYSEQAIHNISSALISFGGEPVEQISTQNQRSQMSESAGKFQQALRNKLISLRET